MILGLQPVVKVLVVRNFLRLWIRKLPHAKILRITDLAIQILNVGFYDMIQIVMLP